tara:strand:+ start:75 stop:1496 length:1422 start_codon:yes stop_codon:yes gene_type:complete
MPVKNKQTVKEQKVKNDKTAQQEQCSVAAIYYYMTKNMNLQQNKDDLLAEFKRIYPKIATDKDGIKWENTFMEQGEVFANSGYTQGKNYKFGWWDAPTKNVTSAPFSKAVDGNTTTVMTQIWELFDDESKKLFGNKKDSWNTADMYLVKNGRGPEIVKWVKDLKKEFLEECCADRGVFIGTINTYLTKLVHMKVLIPISLKKKTDDKGISIKETNMHEWGESGKIEVVKAKFKPNKHPWAYFNVKADGTEITFGAETGRGGNSLQYFADFKVGDYDTGYLIENRLAGLKTKAEVKDIVLNNKGKEVRAAAQTGSVPQPEFEELIKEYTGEDWDFNVPGINEPMSAAQITYWNAYLKDVQEKKSIIGLNLNGFKVLGTEYPLTSTNGKLSWIEKVSEIDSDYLRDPNASKKKYDNLIPGKFHAEFRLKLKQLRFIRALQKANGKLPELLVHLYYLAAKQNVSEGDIHGPFLKIS